MSVHDFLYARNLAHEAETRAALTPTPLLAYFAGRHAEQIALAWPAPHGEFFALPAARRHLAAIALMTATAERRGQVRTMIARAPLNEAIRFVFAHPPRGLARALARLGEPLAAPGFYLQLLGLLENPEAAVVLRHADAIDAALIGKLTALAPILRNTRIVALAHDEAAAQALTDALAAARWINPHRPERDLVLAWSRASDTVRLFRAAIDALRADRFTAIGAPPALPGPYRSIASRALLDIEALRFRNCIASYVHEIGAGEFAVYVREIEPAVMVALKRDVGGWRLAEALHPDNVQLDDALLGAIIGDFAAAGARVGLPIRTIEDRLEAYAHPSAVSPGAARTIGARIGLGLLWR